MPLKLEAGVGVSKFVRWWFVIFSLRHLPGRSKIYYLQRSLFVVQAHNYSFPCGAKRLYSHFETRLSAAYQHRKEIVSTFAKLIDPECICKLFCCSSFDSLSFSCFEKYNKSFGTVLVTPVRIETSSINEIFPISGFDFFCQFYCKILPVLGP